MVRRGARNTVQWERRMYKNWEDFCIWNTNVRQRKFKMMWIECKKKKGNSDETAEWVRCRTNVRDAGTFNDGKANICEQVRIFLRYRNSYKIYHVPSKQRWSYVLRCVRTRGYYFSLRVETEWNYIPHKCEGEGECGSQQVSARETKHCVLCNECNKERVLEITRGEARRQYAS